MDFRGRVAVVTGGASGIGAATADRLRSAGATVVTWDRNAAADVACDVSSVEAVRQALDSTVATAGTPSLFVHCAAITSRSRVTDLDVESWDRVFEVNARGAFVCLGAIAAAMVEAQVDQGSIVLLSSTSSVLADPGSAAYGASKAAVDYIAKVAALELGPHNIRVNSLSPGATETPLTRQSLSSEAYRQLVEATTPLGRVGTPELLAEAITGTLAMEWVTGQSILADGGSHLVTPRGAKRAGVGGNFSAGARTSHDTVS